MKKVQAYMTKSGNIESTPLRAQAFDLSAESEYGRPTTARLSFGGAIWVLNNIQLVKEYMAELEREKGKIDKNVSN